MTEEMDLWLRGIAPSYALLRIALGLNIRLNGVGSLDCRPEKFRRVPAAHVPEDPSARVVRVQFRLCAADCRGSDWRLRTLRIDRRLVVHYGGSRTILRGSHRVIARHSQLFAKLVKYYPIVQRLD